MRLTEKLAVIYVCVYIYTCFLQNKNTEISHKAPIMDY